MKLRSWLLFFTALVFTFFTADLMVESCLVKPGEEANAFFTLLLTLILIYFSSNKLIFYGLGLPFNLGFALYSWIGLSFGLPNYSYLISIFNTNSQEISDFLSFIPTTNFLYPLGIIFGSFVYYHAFRLSKIDLVKSKIFNLVIMLFLFLTVLPINTYYKELFKSLKITNQALDLANISKSIQPIWTDVARVGKQYKTYVLVIGESQRRDYFNAYGYPVKNTPFLSNSKGILLEGLTAGGENTITSLEKMLTNVKAFKAGGDLNSNIIDLANLAGIETYWISNQGHYGSWDTQVSIIADRSKHSEFTNVETDTGDKLDDYVLVLKLAKILKEHEQQTKLIVVHLLGSHEHACNMLKGLKDPYKVKENKYSYLTCYISSIKKTDDILNKIYNLLEQDYKQHHNSFTMLYFADHGLKHITVKEKGSDIIYLHKPQQHSANQYAIPLFEISSDDKERKVCKAFKSGLNFTNGLASWLGITAKQIDPNYSLFDCKDDPNDYGLSKIIDPQSTAEDGKAVDISKYIIQK